MSVIARTFDGEILERNGVFEFRKRPMALFIVAGLCFLAAVLFFGLGHQLASREGEYHALGLFFMGGGGLLAIIGILALIGAVAVASLSRLRCYAILDGPKRIFIVKGQTLSLNDIDSFQEMPFGSQFVSLAAVKYSGETIMLWTVGLSQSAALQALADRFNAFLRPDPVATGSVKEQTLPSLESQREKFVGFIALFIGVLWTMVGYFFFSGLYFASRLQSNGLRIPVWALGIGFIAIGLFFLWKSRRMFGSPDSPKPSKKF